MKDDREELEARIAAFLDGQLPPAEAARLEVYLANTDQELAARVISMVHDKGAVQSLPKPKAPEDLSARIMESVERASLMHGVENLSHPQQRWWHSRSAVAAGLILVLGGFSYFIVQSFYRENTPWNALVAAGGGKPAPRGGAAGRDMPDQIAKAPAGEPESHFDKGKSLDEAAMAKARAPGGGGGSGGFEAKGGQALEVAAASVDEDALEKQLARDQETVNAPLKETLKKGYVGAESPQAALDAVKADGQKFSRGTPALLTLVARDASDPRKLRDLIQTYMTQDGPLSTQQAALLDRVNSVANSGNQFNNGGNTYTSTTMTNGGSLSVNGTAIVGNTGDASISGKNGSGGGALPATTAPAQIAANTGSGVDTKQAVSGSTFNIAPDPQYNGGTNVNGGFQYKVYNPRNRSFDQVANGNGTMTTGNTVLNNTGAAAADSVSAPNVIRGKDNNDIAGGQYAQQGRVGVGRGSLAYAGGQAPFRLMLRPSQLNEIAGKFQVHSVTRGTNAYVISNDRNTDNNIGQKAEIASNPGKNDMEKDPRLASKIAHSAAPAATGAPAGPAPSVPGSAKPAEEMSGGARSAAALPADHGGGEVRAERRDTPALRTAEASPAPIQKSLSDQEQAKESYKPLARQTESARKFGQASGSAEDQWIECIITMEPAPANNASQLDTNMQRNGK